MNLRRTLTLAAAVGALVPILAAPAPAAPPDSRARAVARPVEASHADLGGVSGSDRPARRFVVPVAIDLTGVVVDGVPAALGAYVLRLEFDSSRVAVLAVKGGDAPFAEVPVSTDLDKANATGRIGLTAVQVSSDRTSGLVRVARVLFEERESGGRESVRVRVHSLSTPLMSRASAGSKVQATGAGQAVHSIPVIQ